MVYTIVNIIIPHLFYIILYKNIFVMKYKSIKVCCNIIKTTTSSREKLIAQFLLLRLINKGIRKDIN